MTTRPRPTPCDAFLDSHWTVTARFNRVGLRLEDGSPPGRSRPEELKSERTVSGALEIPSDGRSVLVLCDQRVTGGYPVIAVLEVMKMGIQVTFPASGDLVTYGSLLG